ncbi:hypothetical protein FAQ01_00200 [Flavobacterium aquatile]|nr:hypothetical protein FAQ01_00200 [Flavobacterium aquatile]
MEDGSLFRLKLKIMKKIFLLLFIGFAFSGCEKDDICDPNTPTTPRLIIEFYDDANPTVLKNVVNLKANAEGETDTLNVFNGVSKIALPLKTGTTDLVTKYSFVLNSGGTTENKDFFEINYTGKNVYVSRACGYKNVFTLRDTNPIIDSDNTIPDGKWIKGINIETNAIENENETHVKIYF